MFSSFRPFPNGWFMTVGEGTMLRRADLIQEADDAVA